MRRVLATCLAASAALLVLAQAKGADDAPATTRLYFSGLLAFERQIYSIESTGGGLAQLTFDAPPSTDPIPSPDGRWIAFHRAGSTWLAKANGSGQRQLVEGAYGPVWAPDSSRLAYVGPGGIWIVGVGGGGHRLLVRNNGERTGAPSWSPDGKSLAYVRSAGSIFVVRNGVERRVVGEIDSTGPGITRTLWSPDGRWLAYEVGSELRLVRPDGTGRRSLGPGNRSAWSPRGRLLAFVRHPAVVVYDVATGRERPLPVNVATTTNAISWSPDGSRIAFTKGETVGVITPRGRLGSVFPGLWAEGISWTTPPPGLRYRPPRPLELATPNELRLRAPVAELAADGERVGYRFCNRVGAWRPGSGAVVTLREEPPIHPFCNESLNFYGLAVAGDRVAWGAHDGGIGIEANWLTVADVGVPRTETLIATNPPRQNFGEIVRAGHLVGDGSLLVFSTWVCRDETGGDNCPGTVVPAKPASQTLWRVREPSWPGACPLFGGDFSYAPMQPEGRCQKLRVEQGPLVPFDADDGRILAGGDNATLVLDADGAELLSIPTSALGGQLAGRDLVLLRRGELRQYDAASGELVKVWPLPDVPSGGPCGKPCPRVTLKLEDLARGLALYMLDGRVHLLRLSDGRDTVVAEGTAARFGDGGLFYAYETDSYPWKGRIRFVPFDRLTPLR